MWRCMIAHSTPKIMQQSRQCDHQDVCVLLLSNVRCQIIDALDMLPTMGKILEASETGLDCKSQDSAGDFCTILRVMRYTLQRRDRRLAIGEDTCHGASTHIAD